MNPEIKKRWIEALRSGHYEQGRGALRKKNCYCALGVLCDLYVEEHEQDGVSWAFTSGMNYYIRYDKNQWSYNYDFPIDLVQMWADLHHSNPKFWVERLGKFHTMPDLNDELELSFNEIADILEEADL